jgi:regulation of enolase protein 1 (concanavalin A-like superfamily)
MRLSNLGVVVAVVTATATAAHAGDGGVFKDEFRRKLQPGWSWIREDPAAWRLAKKGGLEIRVQPGNMWGPVNDAKNVLIRPVPRGARDIVELSVTVFNEPARQFEQADLVWYHDDEHMVKIGQELVDGVLNVVMGREEGNNRRTIAKVPIQATSLELRLIVAGDTVRGQYRPSGETVWKDAGACPLPASGSANASLQTYQGPPEGERWVRFSAFRVLIRRGP